MIGSRLARNLSQGFVKKTRAAVAVVASVTVLATGCGGAKPKAEGAPRVLPATKLPNSAASQSPTTSPTSKPTRSSATPDSGQVPDAVVTLVRRLGPERTVGFYVEKETFIVGVTDQSALNDVQALKTSNTDGRIVQYSLAELKRVDLAVGNLGRNRGVSHGIDISEDRVSVELDQTVSKATYRRYEKLKSKYGAALSIKRIAGSVSAD